MKLSVLRDAVEVEWKRREYLARYWNQPALWAEECILWPEGETLRSYQADVLNNIVIHKREAARSLHGIGKTTLAALALHWYSSTRDLVPNRDWKIPTTASVWRQLVKYLWPEIHKWARRLNWAKILRDGPYNPRTELLQFNLKLKRGEAYALASDDPAAMEGAHADHMLYIFDEAKIIPSKTFDAAEGAFAGQGEAFALAISTPGEPSGTFYSIHAHRPGYENWHARHVTLAEAQSAGKGFSAEEVEQLARRWGRDSAVFQNRVLGEFAASAEEQVCPLAWVEAAMDRYRDFHESGDAENVVAPMCAIGVDPARAGKNETIYALRVQNMITKLIDKQNPNLMTTVSDVTALSRENPEAVIIVDLPGLGAGVVDRLLELDVPVVEYKPGARTDYAVPSTGQKFVNLRSAAWWNMREMLNPDNAHKVIPPVMLPPDDMLLGDLCAPRWRRVQAEKVEVEPKDSPSKDEALSLMRWGTVNQRLGRSPDRGDAVVQAFALDVLFPNSGAPAVEISESMVPVGVPVGEYLGNFLDDDDFVPYA